MSTTITRRFEFDAGHRVLGHENKCKYLHGHRYVAEVTLYVHNLDSLGRVIDFGKVKEVIGTWINENWDHNLILSAEDPLFNVYDFIKQQEPLVKEETFYRKPFKMPSGLNTTAEHLAYYLFNISNDLLMRYAKMTKTTKVEVINIRLYETPNCYADCS